MDSINNINQTFKVIKEMLTDQGCDITRLQSVSETELQILHRNSTDIFEIIVNDTMKIIYYMNSKFKINDLRKYIQPSETQKISNIILVFKEKINNFNPKNIDEFANVNLQVFLIKELLFNISKHHLVPKHEVIRDSDEIDTLVNTFNLKKKFQFPIILKTDPMARYLNMQSGELVKITRISPSAGENIIYRCCV